MTQPGATDPRSQPQYGQPEYGQSQYGQPHQPPSGNVPDSGSAGYGQQAQAGYGQQGSYPSAPPAGYGAAATQNRPGMVTAAAVLAFISGGLGLIGGLLAFSVIGSFGVPSSLVSFVILGLVISAGLIYGGVQALQGQELRHPARVGRGIDRDQSDLDAHLLPGVVPDQLHLPDPHHRVPREPAVKGVDHCTRRQDLRLTTPLQG